jgi:transposase-like protein
VIHSTNNRWVLKYAPELEEDFRKRKAPVGSSWRCDETYLKVKGQWKYLNNIVEQDRRGINRRIRPRLGFKSFRSAKKTIAGIELMHMIRKGLMADSRKSTHAEQFYSLAG